MTGNFNEFRDIIESVIQSLKLYVGNSRSGKGKVLNQDVPGRIAEDLELEEWIRNGKINKENIGALLEKYLHYTQHMHHPHYIGHQVAVPHLSAGIADLIHGIINNPMAIYEMGPAAATMEKVVINWMLEKAGWFHGSTLHESDDSIIKGGGVLTHGGSLANLTAMLAARAHVSPDTWTKGFSNDLLVMLPETSHYSLSRAVSIMGIGADNIIPIPVNEKEVIIPEKLEKRINGLKQNDKKIMAVVANACATATGLYDPIDEIAELCKSHGLWFHVDGAHGAGALLLDKEKKHMKGIHKANSMIWDAHKMLRTSALSAAVLFRDHRTLDKTFRQKGSYLIFEKEQIGFDFMHNTIECTKSALGPKIFWALASEGEQGIADYIQKVYDQSKIFYSIINEHLDFECPYFPESNILCFRYNIDNPDDAFQLKLRNELTKNGNFYITTTMLDEKRYLRLTVMNPLTEDNHIRLLLEELSAIAKQIRE